LNGGQTLASVSSGPITFTAPSSAGQYYPSLLVTEYTGASANDDGYIYSGISGSYFNFTPPNMVCAANGPCGTGNMTYHNGSVQHGQKVYTIFWNPPGTSFPTAYQSTINQFLQDLDGSPYYAIASQYTDSAGPVSTHLTFSGTWVDTASALPSSPPTSTEMINEVLLATSTNNWTIDNNSLFMVYTPTGILSNSYCAYHSAATDTTNPSKHLPFALILYPQTLSTGTCLKYPPPFPNITQAIDSAIEETAHELIEAATDPFGGGWYLINTSGEIGDLCVNRPGPRDSSGSDVQMNGHKYLIQMEWSNADSSCVMGYTPPAAPGVSLSSTSLAFGNQAVNTSSAAQTVTIANSGTATLTFTNFAVAGSPAPIGPDFQITANTCGNSLAAGASCALSVIFTPTTAGSRTSAITISDNAAGSPHVVALSGIGINLPPAAQLSAASLSFGNQTTGTVSTAQNVTLTDTGSGTLAVSNIALAGINPADFSETTTCGSTLAASASCVVSISFKPTAAGARTATLIITDNAAGSPHQVALTGTGVIASTSTAFSLSDKGATSSITSGSGSASTGYARILPNVGSTTPTGVAIFGYGPSGILVTEAGVPASPLIQQGRLYAEVGPSGRNGFGTDVGIAIANPSSQTATITFSYTDSNGVDGVSGSYSLPPGQQLAKYLEEAPWNVPLNFKGTFTFRSTVSISVVALQLYNNERNEPLITTLPVIDTTVASSTAPAVLSHFVDGAGWSTSVLLVNPTDSTITGIIQFSNDSGVVSTLTANGQTGNSFSYTIQRRSSFKLQTAGVGNMQSGSVTVHPALAAPNGSTSTPVALAVFSYANGAATTVTQAGVPANAGTAFRLYVEVTSGTPGTAGTYSTGFAVANTSSAAGTITFDLYTTSGVSTGFSTTRSIAGFGHTAGYLTDLFQSLPLPFKGVLRISTSTPGISVVSLRTRYNERTELLMTTTAPSNESAQTSSNELDFPQVVDGGGFTTQLVLFSGAAGQTSSGNLQFVKSDGTPFLLGLGIAP
jgi:hypothetical protein